MKGHLRSADRSALVGNTNFIVLVTKGSDKMPAKPGEIENLQEQVKVIARMPEQPTNVAQLEIAFQAFGLPDKLKDE